MEMEQLLFIIKIDNQRHAQIHVLINSLFKLIHLTFVYHVIINVNYVR